MQNKIPINDTYIAYKKLDTLVKKQKNTKRHYIQIYLILLI